MHSHERLLVYLLFIYFIYLFVYLFIFVINDRTRGKLLRNATVVQNITMTLNDLDYGVLNCRI